MANTTAYGTLVLITIDPEDSDHSTPDVTIGGVGQFAETGNTHPKSTDLTQGVSDGQQAKYGSQANYDIGIIEYDPAIVVTVKAYSALPSTHRKSVQLHYSSGIKVTVNGTRPMIDDPEHQDNGGFAPIRLKGSNVVYGPTAEAAVVAYPS